MNKKIHNIISLANSFLSLAQQKGDVEQIMFLGFEMEKQFKDLAFGNLSQNGNTVVGSGKVTKIIANYWNTKQKSVNVSVDAVVDAPKKTAYFAIQSSDPSLTQILKAAIESSYMQVYKASPSQVIFNAIARDATVASASGRYHLFDGGT